MTNVKISMIMLTTLGLMACGDDGPVPTPDSSMDSGGDSAMMTDCASMPDGAACAEGFICLGEVCSPSECGDGFVDEGRGELCDDGNETPGDGCEPSTCAPSCAMDSDCDNGDPCDGVETCNAALSRCQAGSSGDGSMCMLSGGGDGVCSSGLCAPPGCGDNITNGMEDCDDGMNGDNLDGCKDDCTFSCAEDSDCDDLDACTGVETCDVATHVCSDPADLTCDDADPCTADSCDADTGCVFALIDGDGDGYAVDTCTTAGLMGDDCDDGNSTVYPGAPELCDLLDNDCDTVVDNDTRTVSCLGDSDMDGYGSDTTAPIEACMCPAGRIPPRADGQTDCQDTIPAVHEGVTAFFATGYCPPRTLCTLPGGAFLYDYNCDGTEEKRWTLTRRTTACLSLDCRDSWTVSAVPDCGDSANFRDCSSVILPSGVRDCITVSVGLRTQECR